MDKSEAEKRARVDKKKKAENQKCAEEKAKLIKEFCEAHKREQEESLRIILENYKKDFSKGSTSNWLNVFIIIYVDIALQRKTWNI